MNAAKMDDNQRRSLKTSILKSFLQLIESQPGLKDDPEMKEAADDIKKDLKGMNDETIKR